MKQSYIEPTREAGVELFSRNIVGGVIMLNLLQLKETADYSTTPALAPAKPVSGRRALQRYIDHTLPLLKASGGDLLFLGDGGRFFIGPEDEKWDVVMLVKQNSLASFMAFATSAEYLEGIGHRTAAVADSRLLPIIQRPGVNIL